MQDFIKQKITIITVTTIFRAGLIGLLSAEAWYFSTSIAERLDEIIAGVDGELWALFLGVVGLSSVIVYLLSRNFFTILLRIVKSKRFDLFIAFVFGVLASGLLGGIGMGSYNYLISFVSDRQLLVLTSLPFMAGFLVLTRAVQLWWIERSREKITPFFISDVEEKYKEKDLLQFAENANRFAERVINRGSLDSMVFGIDAPWGIGKSTFINFCEEYWIENHRESVILYKFNPLRYEGRVNLLEKFIDGLIRIIQDNSFSPEIRPLISNYSRFIKSTKTTFTFPGLNFEVFWASYTIDDAFNDLESTLSGLDKKVIIVVDDLDRMNFSAIKDIIFVIKKSFPLPNISYVLAYDTENIAALEGKKYDTEKVTEFLEKFVNVKISLFLGSKILSEYISKNLDKALESNLQIDPATRKEIKQVMLSIEKIYRSRDFHKYSPFLGDIRKLKRIINTLLLFEIEKTDFENSDFNKRDLIHLILIYLNYPSIFRKIYEAETNGKRGFFSVVMPHDHNYPKDPVGQQNRRIRDSIYKNSTDYKKYVRSVSSRQKFLLNKVFNVSRLKGAPIDSVPEKAKRYYACFNGVWGGGRNLEEYLNLIVNASKPRKVNQYRFYLNCKNDIIKGRDIKDILSEHKDFSYSRSESSHEQLWRVIINSLHEFDSKTGSKLITYLLNNIQKYSLFTDKNIGVGLRDDVDYFLVAALNVGGWGDENGKHINNTEQNIVEIAEWVFGEGRHKGEGIIYTLAEEKRGVLGLYDTLVFRLFCSADRGGDFFNLSRALSKHGDPDAPTTGSTSSLAVEEMREISQKVFSIFKAQYIEQNRNLFDLIDNLSLADFSGKYRDFIKEGIKSGKVEKAKQRVEELKSRMKSFIFYQLGNVLISSGVGCGYYDEAGRLDENGIRTKINDYLFGECFNPEKDGENYEHFIDYLLINFASGFDLGSGDKYTPHFGEFTKVLIPDRLYDYWREHREAIKGLNLERKGKVVFQGNYSASYQEDLVGVYKVLDKALEEAEQKRLHQQKVLRVIKNLWKKKVSKIYLDQ